MSIKFIGSTDEFEDLLAKEKYLVANFTASWCAPCQHIKPAIDELYKNDDYKKIELVRIDLDKQQELARKFMVTSIPTFIYFCDAKEVNRTTGANLQDVHQKLNKLKEKADDDPTAVLRASYIEKADSLVENPWFQEIQSDIPKGFEIINSTIHSPGFQALNCLSLDSKTETKAVFDIKMKGLKTIVSDADSQLLFFFPLNNVCKLHSILIKLKPVEELQKEVENRSLELDEDEIKQECQTPSVVKVWINKENIMSFEDAVSDSNAPFSENFGSTNDNWLRCKLKYVRFQNVKTLNIFIDGADEDLHTMIDSIVLLGVTGESSEQATIRSLED